MPLKRTCWDSMRSMRGGGHEWPDLLHDEGGVMWCQFAKLKRIHHHHSQLGFDTRRSQSILRTFKSLNNIIALNSQISLPSRTNCHKLDVLCQNGAIIFRRKSKEVGQTAGRDAFRPMGR